MVLFWHRRDLRIEDNAGLFKALKEQDQVQPIFIFDSLILGELPINDQRVPKGLLRQTYCINSCHCTGTFLFGSVYQSRL